MAENKPETANDKPDGSNQEQAAQTAAGKTNGGGPKAEGPGSPFMGLAAEISRLETELKESNENELRVQAELENYRKRARRELEDERRYANVALLRDLLPVVDNMERAISAAEKSPDATGLLEGIRMVAQSLHTTLSRYHCRRIEALGKAFDPAVHEAIAQQPSADHPPHTILAVGQDGYMVHERVVRPAQVVVSVAP